MRPTSSLIPASVRGYVRSRAIEIAKPTTRAMSEPLADWALRRVRLDGRPFRFEGHEYLKPIYDDTAQHIVLTKAAQIGGTTWAILKALHACTMGLNCLYLFPTKTDVIEFSKSRVGPLLRENRFLGRLVRDTDTAGLKRIGDSYLYLRGMQSTVGIKSIPVDMIVFDELDEATPDAKALAKERLSHSDFKRIVELSNPSLPDYGIDEAYQLSDQRHWTVRCDRCRTWTALDKEFPDKLGQEVRIIRQREDDEYYRACPKCDAELDMAEGEWVADFPDRKTHGYLISQLFSPKVDAGEILLDYRRTRFPERFYNLKIGIAWADNQNRLTAAEVLTHCGEHGLLEESTEPCTMGVDTGKELHVVISRFNVKKKDKREVVFIGTRQEYTELDELMKRFEVSKCVIDALPEIHATREFANRFHGRVLMNYFVESQRGSYSWDYKEHIVRENRTEALDASRKVVRDGRVVFPRSGKLMQEFAEHMAADVKQLIEDQETGAKSFRYVRTGTDHYSLAFTYDCIAWSGESTGQPVFVGTPENAPLNDPFIGQRF
ncbi:MAG: phage terminase large subunit family protein [Acidobacteria bacterium]|nr:phage terminase large subunit family protein [Acidobacteriota bacterium]